MSEERPCRKESRRQVAENEGTAKGQWSHNLFIGGEESFGCPEKKIDCYFVILQARIKDDADMK